MPVRRLLMIPALLAALAVGGQQPATAAPLTPYIAKQDPYHLSVTPSAWKRTRGTVMTLHGGSWRGDLGAEADRMMAPWIGALRQRGYRVVNVGYRSGSLSLTDASDAFKLVNARYGRGPLCLWGGSAGAHLSLVLASRHARQVDCVVDLAGPVDLVNWGPGTPAELGKEAAIEAFGESRLAQLSPIRRARRIKAPTLIAAAQCDIFTPLRHQRKFARKLRRTGSPTRLFVFAPGNGVYGAHCETSRQSMNRFLDVQSRFLKRFAR